jgi:diguanylate cyclase (GGDEF)-like protein
MSGWKVVRKRFNRRTAGLYRRQPWSTWAFTVLLALIVGLSWPEVTGRLSAISAPWRMPWLLLAAGFAAGHVMAIRFEFLGETQEVTLSEVPLLIGLVFAGTDRLLLATAVGSAAAVLWRRHPPVKSVFNVAVRLLETVVAAVCFHAVLGHAGAISLKGLLAAFVAVPAANLVSAVCVQIVIALSVGRFNRSGLKTLAVVLAGVAVLNVAVAMVAVVLLWVNPLAVLPFLPIAVVLGFGYRSHSGLRRRHRDLEEIYRFSRALVSLTDTDEVVHAVLSEAKSRLRGALAELALDEVDGTARYTLRGDGPLVRRFEPGLHPLRAPGARGGIVARKTTRDTELAAGLAAGGFRDAVVVPLPTVQDLVGTLLVADRQSDQVSFEPADMQLLEVLANYTATALHAARLLAWLRQEVDAKSHLALHDTLTDLANRSLFNEQVEASLAHSGDASVVAVMLMDLDRFKQVNDTFGHQGGDEMLQQIAAQLTRAVGAKGSVGRLGGDEFAVVTVLDNRAELAIAARDVLSAGHAEMVVDGVRLDVSASLGVAVAPDHGRDRSTLLRAADVAMYQAKANGGGAALYDPERTRQPGLRDGSSRWALPAEALLCGLAADAEGVVDLAPRSPSTTGRAKSPDDPLFAGGTPQRSRGQHARPQARSTKKERTVARSEDLALNATSPTTELVMNFTLTAQALLLAGGVEATLQAVVDLAVLTIEGCDLAGIFALDGGIVSTAVYTDPLVAKADALQLRTGQGPCLDAIAQGSPTYAEDLADDPRWPGFGPDAAAMGVRSVLAFRLSANGALGALNLYARYPAAFGADDRAKGQVLAGLAGVAMFLAQAHEKDARRTKDLHHALASRELIGQAQGILMERERITGEQAFDILRQASQYLNVKLREVAQDLVDTGERPHTGPGTREP